MAKKASQKRIFAREQVEVDPRSGGIKGASRPSQALGDIHGSSNVGRSYVDPAWSSVSETLSALIAGVHTNAKEESELDKKLQVMMGKAAAIEADSAVREGVIKGEITSLEQARGRLMEEHAKANPSMNPYFRMGAMEVGLKTMERESTIWNEKLRAETEDSGMRTASYSLREAFQGVKNGIVSAEDFEERLRLSHEVAQGYGVPVPEIRKATFDLAQSSVESAVLAGDIVRAVEMIDLYSKSSLTGYALPGQPGSPEALHKAALAASDQHTARQRQIDADYQSKVKREQSDNYSAFLGKVAQAKPEELPGLEAELEAMSPEEVIFKFGPAGADLPVLAYNQRIFRLEQKKPVGNDEAIRTIEKLFAEEDVRIIHEDGVLESFREKLLPTQLQKYEGMRKELRERQDPSIQALIQEAVIELDNYFAPQKTDKAGRPVYGDIPYEGIALRTEDPRNPLVKKFNALGLYVEKRMGDEVRKINPADPKYENNPDLLRHAQILAYKSVVDEAKAGRADWLVQRANLGLRPGETGITTDPRFFTEEDMTNPEKKAAFDRLVHNPKDSLARRQLTANSLKDPKLRERTKAEISSAIASREAIKVRQELFGENEADRNLPLMYYSGLAAQGGETDTRLTNLEKEMAEKQLAINAIKDRQKASTRELDVRMDQHFINQHEKELNKLKEQYEEIQKEKYQ